MSPSQVDEEEMENKEEELNRIGANEEQIIEFENFDENLELDPHHE